jgi:hypothetical protein
VILIKDIIKPCADHQRRTCIQVDRKDGEVMYIELDIDTGLEVRALPEQNFDQRFKPLVDYPPSRACQLYAEYSRTMGATPDALNFLKALVPITQEEYDMAVNRKPRDKAQAVALATKETKARAPKGRASEKVTKIKTAPAKKPAAKKAVATGKPETPAAMFRDLILAGEHTDDAIFAKVQKKFGLDDNKRSYVAWYRNSLKKAGHKVPDPKK